MLFEHYREHCSLFGVVPWSLITESDIVMPSDRPHTFPAAYSVSESSGPKYLRMSSSVILIWQTFSSVKSPVNFEVSSNVSHASVCESKLKP